MFIISIILVALPLKRHRGFKFQAPITPQMFFVPDNIPNCLQRGNVFWKKCFLLLLKNQQKKRFFQKIFPIWKQFGIFSSKFSDKFRLLLAREMMLKVRKWQSRPEEGIRSLPWERGGVDLLGICGRGAGGNRIVSEKFLSIFTLTASFWMMKLSIH